MTIQPGRLNYKTEYRLICKKHRCNLFHGLYSKKKEYRKFHYMHKGEFKFCPLCIHDYEKQKDRQLKLF